MPAKNFEHSPLVKELVDVMLSKFEQQPAIDRSLVVIASIEATAWIASMESISHCKRHGLGPKEHRERFGQYCQAFATVGAIELEASD